MVFELQLLILEILIAIRCDFGGIGVVERDSGEIAANDGLRFGSLWCFRLVKSVGELKVLVNFR